MRVEPWLRRASRKSSWFAQAASLTGESGVDQYLQIGAPNLVRFHRVISTK